MSWHKVDDKFAAHPKVERLEALGPERHAFAIAAWTLLGSDCAFLDMGGAIAPSRVKKVLSAWTEKARQRAIDDLISVGLIDKTDDGVAFHDWDEYRKKDRNDEESRAYEARKKAAQRARARERTGESENVQGHVPQMSPTHDLGTCPDPRARVSQPVPTRPVPTSVPTKGTPTQGHAPEHAQGRSGFCSALYASWKAAFGRVPGTGHPDKLDASWGILGAGLTRHEAATLEKCQAVASVMTAEQLPEAIENFKADSFATKSNHSFDLFVRQAPQYLGRRPRHPSAVSDFSDAPENPEL